MSTVQRPGDPQADAGPPLFCTRISIAADDEILVSGPTVAADASGPGGVEDRRPRIPGRDRAADGHGAQGRHVVTGGEMSPPPRWRRCSSAIPVFWRLRSTDDQSAVGGVRGRHRGAPSGRIAERRGVARALRAVTGALQGPQGDRGAHGAVAAHAVRQAPAPGPGLAGSAVGAQGPALSSRCREYDAANARKAQPAHRRRRDGAGHLSLGFRGHAHRRPGRGPGCNGGVCRTVADALTSVADGDTVSLKHTRTPYSEAPLVLTKRNVTIEAQPGGAIITSSSTATGTPVLRVGNGTAPAGEGTTLRNLYVNGQPNGGPAVRISAAGTTLTSTFLSRVAASTRTALRWRSTTPSAVRRR